MLGLLSSPCEHGASAQKLVQSELELWLGLAFRALAQQGVKNPELFVREFALLPSLDFRLPTVSLLSPLGLFQANRLVPGLPFATLLQSMSLLPSQVPNAVAVWLDHAFPPLSLDEELRLEAGKRLAFDCLAALGNGHAVDAEGGEVPASKEQGATFAASLVMADALALWLDHHLSAGDTSLPAMEKLLDAFASMGLASNSKGAGSVRLRDLGLGHAKERVILSILASALKGGFERARAQAESAVLKSAVGLAGGFLRK